MEKADIEKGRSIVRTKILYVDGEKILRQTLDQVLENLPLGKICLTEIEADLTADSPREGMYRVASRRLKGIGKDGCFEETYTWIRIADEVNDLIEGEERMGNIYLN